MKINTLKDTLIHEINSGIFTNKKFPTEDQLIKQYGVTRYTLRRVIDELVDLGLVYKVQGSGVYIRESKREGYLPLSSTNGITNDLPGADLSTSVISLELLPASQKDKIDFKCDENFEVYHVNRLRLIDGEPFCLEYSRFSKKYITYLNNEIISESIFKYINEAFKLEIGFADKIIEGAKLNSTDANQLNLFENDPSIVIYDTIYLKTGEIFNCSQVLYHYKKVKFFDLAKYKK